METGLKGRTVLITGASRNLGRLAALAFAREGANLAICTSSKMEELETVAAEACGEGAKVFAARCDVTDAAAVAAFVDRVSGALGRVDVAINAAGYRCEGKFLELDTRHWVRNIEVNLGGAFHVCRSVLPLMVERRWGRIINASGTAAAYRGSGVAKATVKLGIVGYTRGIAKEFGPHNITANCISPGAIARSQTESSDAPWALPDAQVIRRPGTQGEMVSLLLYLASENAGFITGQCYLANGGTYFQ